MKKLLIIGVLLLSSLSYAANSATDTVPQEVAKDQDSIYKARKTWVDDRKYELLALCDKLINMHDFPKTNIDAERDKLKLKLRMYVKEIRTVDYADDKKFEGIQKKFDHLESYFRSYPQKLREKENLKW
jgi:hypothetical protein